jgi:hypothetical protein
MPTTDDISTTRPQRARIIPRAARFSSRKLPVRFVSRTASQSSSPIRNSSVSEVMPALATSTSTGPCSRSASEKAESTCSESVTSHFTARTPSGGSPLR